MSNGGREVGLVFNLNGCGGGSGSVKLKSLAVIKPPKKTIYKSGESFDPTGMVVEAGYSFGLTSEVTGYTVTPAVLTDGVTEVIITYTEGRVIETASTPVTVEKVLTSIEVTTPPTKTLYDYLESFDPTGMVVTATFSDGSSEYVTGYSYTNAAFSTLGDQVVNLDYTYEGVTKSTHISVVVNAIEMAIPVQKDILTYDGISKSPAWDGYDSIKMALTGDINGVNAGTYTVKFTLPYGYLFSNGDSEVTVDWVINRAVIASLPVQSNNLVADGTSKSPIWEGYEAGQLTIGGDTSATEPGDYTAIFTPTANYQWWDGTTETKSVTWTIIKPVTIYGVEWDWTDSGPTKGTRTDAAAEFSDPSPAVNNGSGSSPFDNLMPWAGMVKETRAGGVEVKEPKYWFKWTKTGKKLKLQIADGPVEGFYVDPVNMDRDDGLGELDFSYIGRYHCAPDTYKSETNKAQRVTITRSMARTSIHNLGSNFWQIDFAQMWYVGMLYLVEFADWDGQKTIGRGGSASGYKRLENNGMTDVMQYHTGTTAANRDTYGYTQYRNIEGWWDNVYDWMDGCYYNGNGLNIIKNPNQFSDSANGTLIGSMPSSGYPNDMAIPTQSGFEWALRPASTAGSDSSYVPDEWFISASNPCLRHGGFYSQVLYFGPFSVGCSGASTTSSSIGCRLQERPPKTA